MKKLFYRCVVVLLCASFVAMTGCLHKSDPLVNDTNGQAFRLSQLHGKWIIVNFWAGWCDACREEIPALNHFNEKIKNSNIILYGINYDGLTNQDLIDEMHKMKMDYPNLLTNPGWAWGLTDISVLPTTFIISPKGQVIKKFVGGTTEKNLEATLAMLQKTF